MIILYNNRPFFQKFSKELTIVLPAQETQPVVPLSTQIAQFGLNATEVCEKFNKASTIFPPGLLVPVSIFYIPKEKIFDLCFRPFQLKHLLQQFIVFNEEERRYQIELIDLYKILLIKGNTLNLTSKQEKIYLRNILGTLKSYDRPVEIKTSTNIYNNLFFSNENLIYNTEITSNEFLQKFIEKREKNILEKEKKKNEKEEQLSEQIKEKLKEQLEKKKQEEEEIEDFYDTKFGIRKIKLYKNKKRLVRKIEKQKKYLAFQLWSTLPFSLLVFTPKIKDFHYLKRFLYELNKSIVIRKQRFFYKKNYNEKEHTAFACYRIFMPNLYNIYSIMEYIIEYDITILGIEIKGKIYSIELISLLLKDLKNSLKGFFNIFNNINKIFQSSFINISEFNYYQNLKFFFDLCQHITK